jgi:hypothetical protein
MVASKTSNSRKQIAEQPFDGKLPLRASAGAPTAKKPYDRLEVSAVSAVVCALCSRGSEPDGKAAPPPRGQAQGTPQTHRGIHEG